MLASSVFFGAFQIFQDRQPRRPPVRAAWPFSTTTLVKIWLEQSRVGV